VRVPYWPLNGTMLAVDTGDKTVTSSWRPTRGEAAHRLLVVFSPDPDLTGRAVLLANEPLHIGRTDTGGRGKSLVLADDKTSREHAFIEPGAEAGTFRLRDLASRNGTFVDGHRTTELVLQSGQVIRVGSHVLLFQSLDAEAMLHLFDRASSSSPLVGGSYAMQQVLRAIRAAGPQPWPTLLTGESGVGKELVARAIHDASGRQGAYIPVNCAALPENLVESELFGHARGAFTGAGLRRGLFREAEGGTLFLDEISEMRLDLQAKLLRVLATGEIRPVGDDRPQQVDVRVLAATNTDLERGVEEGKFRADLYARLMGYVIPVPPLRERRDDILTLARHFLARGDHGVEIGADAAEALCIHQWPYNVRELEHVMAVAGMAAARHGLVELEHLPEKLQQPFEERLQAVAPGVAPTPSAAPSALLTVRRDATPTAVELRQVFEACDGNVSRVAAFFGKDRRQIYRWARRLGIAPETYRASEEGDDDGHDPAEGLGEV
jgi:transcriptional regulator with GAF, ATPase, and Fis domain